MRICTIGPAYPLRGGISHHTTLLHTHLGERHEVRTISFARLYPTIFFPGKSQFEPDPPVQTIEVERIIDSINPLSWRRASGKIRMFGPDMVLIQWWHPFFSPCLAFIASHVNGKVVFICHNVLPHEAGFATKLLATRALKTADAFIVHADEQRELLQRFFPATPIERTVLPEFHLFPRQYITKDEARSRLGVRGRVILFFGLVREYKGLMDLIRAMSFLRDLHVTCLVAGEFYDDPRPYMSEISALGLHDFIRVDNGYIPGDQVETYFAASDVVVLPYLSATQSGIVQTAYYFERPVICTSVGGLPEVVDHDRTGLLVPPHRPDALADAIRRYYEEHLEPALTDGIRHAKDRFSWDRVVETIERIGASP